MIDSRVEWDTESLLSRGGMLCSCELRLESSDIVEVDVIVDVEIETVALGFR